MGLYGGYRVVDVEEAFTGGQLVVLLDPLQASDRQEHANRGAQGEEVDRLKVQSVVDHRHLARQGTVGQACVFYFD